MHIIIIMLLHPRDEKLIARPIEFCPSASVEQYNLRDSTKIILPPSCLGYIEPELLSGSPLTVRIKTESGIRDLCASVHEFTALEGFIFIPQACMNSHLIEMEELCTVESISFQTCKSMTLAPLSGYLPRYGINKEEIEKIVSQNYKVVSTGNVIVTSQDHFEIIQVNPDLEAVSLHNCDPEILFDKFKTHDPLPIPFDPPPPQAPVIRKKRTKKTFSKRTTLKKFPGKGNTLA